MSFIKNGLYFVGLLFTIFPMKYSESIIIIALSLVILLKIIEIGISKRLPTIAINSWGLFMFIWLIYSLYTKRWVINIAAWEYNNEYLLIATLFTIVIGLMFSDSNFVRLNLYIISFFLIIHIAIGLFEVATGVYIFSSNYGDLGWYKLARYPVSFFYNTNDYATFLLFGICCLLTIDLSKDFKKNLSLFYGIRNILVILTLILIYMTDSRINTALSIVIIMIYIYMKTNLLIHKNLSFVFIGFGLLIIVLLLYSQKNLIQNYIVADASGETRFILMRDSLNLLKLSDYRGVGTGNLSSVYQLYRGSYSDKIISIHNWWIEILVTYGVVFFSVYITYYIRKMFKSLKIIFQNRNESFYLIWLIIFIPASLASSTLFDKIWIWAMNSIVILSVIKLQREERYKKEVSSEIK